MNNQSSQPNRHFCTHCGSPLSSSDRFCKRCGLAINAFPVQPAPVNQPLQPTQATWANSPAPKVKKKSPLGKIIGFTLGGFGLILILLMIIGLFAGSDEGATSEKLSLGDTSELVNQELGKNGGKITVDQGDSDLNGLTFTVPKDAYPDNREWTISETPIKAHEYGELFHPVTPLISVDNGHEFSAKPMTVTIPIEKSADEFAMAFYYDPDSGSLEGIPCLAQDEDSITITTAHFSDIVVSTVKKSMLEGRIQNDEATTDFMPGMSDFFAPNLGTIAEYDGHCTGQSLAEIHFYNANGNDNYNGKTLRGEDGVDNNQLPATPGFWQDDSLAYRFCTLLQHDFLWTKAITDNMLNLPEDLVYYSFGYAMALTHSPQVIVIYGNDAKTGAEVGHTMVVYEVTPDGLAIADPNYPGKLNRNIQLKKETSGKTVKLELLNYNSGANANDLGTSFNQFSYFGTYALINHDKIDRLWQDVLAGKDVAAGLLPPDASFVAITGMDSKKKVVVSDLKDGMTVEKTKLAEYDSKNPQTIYITIPKADANARFTFYSGTDKLGHTSAKFGQNNNIWALIPLKMGANDVGILYEQLDPNGNYAYINFYRYQINLAEGPTPTLTPTPSPTPKVTKPQISTWSMTVTYTDECKHSSGIAQISHSLPFYDADHLNKPYTCNVTLTAKNIKNLGNGSISFTVDEYAGYVFTGKKSADGKTISGTLIGHWNNNQHWIKGKFTMKLIS